MKDIKPIEFSENIWKIVGSDWMLIAAGGPEHHNAMTAGWGGSGVMCGKNIFWCVVRPQRYTKEFLDTNNFFTLIFFDKSYHQELSLYGSKSGRDIDKAKACGFSPIAAAAPNTTTYKEAKYTVTLKKMICTQLGADSFIDKGLIDQWYPHSDFHYMYMGEIVSVEENTDFKSKG